MTPSSASKGANGAKPLAAPEAGAANSANPPAASKTKAPKAPAPPDLMRFKECADDASVGVKTIGRWVKAGLLTEWRPHPKSRTRRIKRQVWEAFKQRFRK